MPEYKYERQAQALESSDDVSGAYDVNDGLEEKKEEAATPTARGVPIQSATKAYVRPYDEEGQYDMDDDPFAESRRGERAARSGFRYEDVFTVTHPFRDLSSSS